MHRRRHSRSIEKKMGRNENNQIKQHKVNDKEKEEKPPRVTNPATRTRWPPGCSIPFPGLFASCQEATLHLSRLPGYPLDSVLQAPRHPLERRPAGPSDHTLITIVQSKKKKDETNCVPDEPPTINLIQKPAKRSASRPRHASTKKTGQANSRIAHQ